MPADLRCLRVGHLHHVYALPAVPLVPCPPCRGVPVDQFHLVVVLLVPEVLVEPVRQRVGRGELRVQRPL